MDHMATDTAAAFLRAHLAEPVTVADVADHVGYSPAHLARAFARERGLGPAAYLAALRFHAAKSLLLAEDLPVVDVCTAVGYASLATFTRRFSAAVGVAPGRFRALAEDLSSTEQTPFALSSGSEPAVRVRWELPGTGLRRGRLVWVGWYPSPVPIGLPHAGRLVAGTDGTTLPLCPGAPWLLAFTVEPDAEIAAHLAPEAPLVAAHPCPVREDPTGPPADVLLRFSTPRAGGPPLLSALPALRPRAERRIE